MHSKQQRRTRHVGVRFTPEEYSQLEQQAQAAAIEVSALLRAVAVNAAIPRRAKRKSADIKALGQALATLNKIGGLLNQIAKTANMVGDLSAFHAAQEDRGRLAEAARAVMTALES